ncbi:MAG TPA: hypothetical protein VJQ43_04405, partial [Thermoplasmata archaeon]|nr:hypothetical protein [Thermoplasmata archaeon]
MKVVTVAMRRTSGIALATIATFAVLLALVSVGAGAVGLHPSGAVRTTGGAATPASHASLTHAALGAATAHAAVAAPRASAFPPPPPMNVTLTSVSIAP